MCFGGRGKWEGGVGFEDDEGMKLDGTPLREGGRALKWGRRGWGPLTSSRLLVTGRYFNT